MADVGQLVLAAVADLDRRHLVPRREAEQRCAPVTRAEEVGDDEHDSALPCDRAHAIEGGAERRRADLLRLGLLPRREKGAEQAPSSLTLRDGDGIRAAERERADSVPASRGDMSERERDALDDVRLAAVPRAEAHRGRHVEHEPGRDGALGDVHPHVQLVLARRRVPVDAPDVVSVRVRPDLCELGAAAQPRRPVLAVDEPDRAPGDAEVERAQETGRDGSRARLRRRPLELGEREGHAARSTTSRLGTGTAASAASISVSSATSVAIAS